MSRRAGFEFGNQIGYEAETLNIFAAYQVEAMESMRKKNYVNLFNIIDVIYITAKEKLGSNLPNDFDDKVKALDNKIFTSNKLTPQQRSKLYQETRELWGYMAKALIKENLMFHTQVDIGKMVAD